MQHHIAYKDKVQRTTTMCLQLMTTSGVRCNLVLLTILNCMDNNNNNNNNNNMYLKSSIQTSSIDYIKENIHITLNISSNIPIQ